MKLPSLPTDEFYKFQLVAGLVLIFGGLFVASYLLLEADRRTNEKLIKNFRYIESYGKNDELSKKNDYLAAKDSYDKFSSLFAALYIACTVSILLGVNWALRGQSNWQKMQAKKDEYAMLFYDNEIRKLNTEKDDDSA